MPLFGKGLVSTTQITYYTGGSKPTSRNLAAKFTHDTKLVLDHFIYVYFIDWREYMFSTVNTYVALSDPDSMKF